MASEKGILEISDLAFAYPGGELSIRGLCLSVGQGEFVGILGPNGSGKSTILQLCSGILKPRGGEVLLWSKPLMQYAQKDRAKLMSYLPQQIDISVPFTVRELVAMGRYPYDIPPHMGIDEALAIAGLSEKADAHLADLSGGERRRTFIAMTLVQGAGMLLLDEPLANLDVKYQIELIRLLRTLREEKGITVLMALHDIGLALEFDRVVLIREGAVLGDGLPADVLQNRRLADAFGVDVAVRRLADGGIYVHYGTDRSGLMQPEGVSPSPSFRFFQNRSCAYFPCHPADPSLMNCLFCFCPLYYAVCPGTPRYIEQNGTVTKDCSGCDYPHHADRYDTIMAELRKIHGSSRNREH